MKKLIQSNSLITFLFLVINLIFYDFVLALISLGFLTFFSFLKDAKDSKKNKYIKKLETTNLFISISILYSKV